MNILDLIGYGFMALSGFLFISGSLGVFRFRGGLSKLHFIGPMECFALPCLIIGLCFFNVNLDIKLKMIGLMILFWLVSPVNTQLLAKLYYQNTYDKPNK